MEVVDRKKRRKLTKRKKVDPCMESQPLASADQADAGTQAQCMAAESPNAGACAAHCTVALAAGDAFQAGPVASSVGANQDHASVRHTAADNLLQVQASAVLNHNHGEGLLVASVASPNRDLASEAARMEDVAEVTGSQEGSLAAVPPSDDEAEVCTSGCLLAG